jgi:hypothetical protein
MRNSQGFVIETWTVFSQGKSDAQNGKLGYAAWSSHTKTLCVKSPFRFPLHPSAGLGEVLHRITRCRVGISADTPTCRSN